MDWICVDDKPISDENLSSDISSHQNIFHNILNQISGNSQYETPFLHLLQHLLRIEYKNNELPAIIWDSAETLVGRAITSINSKEDAENLLRLLQRRKGSIDLLSIGLVHNKSSNQINDTNDKIKGQSEKSGPPPPPPPLSIPLTLVSPPPPPPPPPPSFTNLDSKTSPVGAQVNGRTQMNGQLSCPLSSRIVMRSKSSEVNSKESPVLSRKLPQQEIPKPKSKMKSINWSKIPSEKVISTTKPNLWSLVATKHESDFHMNVDFSELEDLFCQPTNSSAPNSCPGSPRLPRRPVSSEIVGSPYNSLERKISKRQSGEYQTPNELQLLDGKKSLNVNIFLKQYRGSIEELINKISDGEHKEIGTERLKNLLRILPEPNEIELFKNNKEEIHRMPIAERFLLNLIKIPNYKLKIEGMLLKEEFESNVHYLEPAIQSVCSAAQEIRQSKALHEILYLILVSGNFLNSGGYAGDAAGFKMMALLKLPEIRANKAGVNLIHYVAMQAEKKGLHNFILELPSLEEASKVSIENLRIEVNSLSDKIRIIKEQIEKQKDDLLLYDDMNSFLKSSEKVMQKLSLAIENQLNTIRIEMAEFLCEDLDRFKLEECFRIFSSFCQRFKLAMDENERRRENEMKLEARKSNSHLKRWTNSCESDNFLTETSLTPTTSSNSLLNSLNGSFNCEQKLKRRSRRSSQDDELHAGLLEFLKTANDLGTNDTPIFGGTFRRMGSGRRSRSSNPISESDLNSRDRNTNESKAKDKIDELESNESVNKKIKVNSDLIDKRLIKSTTNLSEGESEEESNPKKNFDRFSPLRKTLSCKPSELESRLAKRLNKIENNQILVKSDGNNNNLIENQNIKQNINENIELEERIVSPSQLKQYWGAKHNNFKEFKNAITRPSTLHLSSNHHNSQQPTAVISPTKVVRNDQKENTNALLSPVLALETDRLNRSGCLPHRLSITSPSNATAAAIVTPIQINVEVVDKPISSIPLKSKLPVRKNPLTPFPQQRKNGNNEQTIAMKSSIPSPSRTTVSRQNTSSGVKNNRVFNQSPNARTYRSPSTVSRTQLNSDMGSVASMRRSSQLLTPNRSFMKQTSSSAAKTRTYSRY